MDRYNELLDLAANENIQVKETYLPYNMDGLYYDNNIVLNSKLDDIEKCCTLAEEIGHYIFNFSNLLDQDDLNNIKEELKARKWAYDQLLPLEKIIDCYEAHCESIFDMAEYLELSEKFIKEAVLYCHQKYGEYTEYKDYIIYWNPLGVIKTF